MRDVYIVVSIRHPWAHCQKTVLVLLVIGQKMYICNAMQFLFWWGHAVDVHAMSLWMAWNSRCNLEELDYWPGLL